MSSVFLTTVGTFLDYNRAGEQVRRTQESEFKKGKQQLSRAWERWESGTAGDDVDLQAVGAGPLQVDQDAVHPRVQ